MTLFRTLAAATIVFACSPAAAQESAAESGQNSSATGAARASTDTENLKFTVRSDLVFLPTRVQTKKGETV
jgi:hypothetical protein